MAEYRRQFENPHGRNDRFRYELRERDGVEIFVKTACMSELQQNLEREILWSNFVNFVQDRHPEARVHGVDIIGFDSAGGLEMRYIDAPLVAAPNDLQSWVDNMDRYAHMLYLFDAAAQAKPDVGQEPAGSALNGIDDIKSTWRRWLGEHFDAIEQLDEAYAFVGKALPSLEMQLQHGDLTPWQIFDRHGEWVVYDGEKAGTHLPRYNDLAYGFGRLYTRLQSPDAARQLLGAFVHHATIDQDEFMHAFLPVLTFRAVGMIGDAYLDTKTVHIEDACELLRICLRGQVSDFLEG